LIGERGPRGPQGASSAVDEASVLTAVQDNSSEVADAVRSDVLNELCSQMQLSDNSSLSDVGLLAC
jgi:hypothetical protein